MAVAAAGVLLRVAVALEAPRAMAVDGSGKGCEWWLCWMTRELGMWMEPARTNATAALNRG
jgi:hypothetical protein